MTVGNDIKQALESEIANVVGIPAAAQRSWENVPFKPTTGTPWVEMTLLPASSRKSAIGPSENYRHDGQFLVALNYPDSTKGTAAVDALADAVRARFKIPVTLTSGGTTVRFNWSERNQGVRLAPWWIVTVTISWYAYAST